MKNFAPALFIFLSILGAFLPLTARAAGNICFYNGEKNDDRYGQPKNFTGEYSCKDMDTGKTTLSEHQVGGKRDGKYQKFDPKTGQLEEEGLYKADKLDGVMKRYNNGKLALEFAYINGKTQGVQKNYKDGILSRVYLVLPNGQVDTDFSLNHSGQLTELKCGQNQIAKKDAEWCARDGKLSSVELYNEDGKVKEKQQYLWGLKSGVDQRYNTQTNQMMSEEHYEKGKRLKDGEKYFDPKGAMLSKSDCDQSRKSCKETEFFPGGKETQSIVEWENGKKVHQLFYYQNGKKQKEIVAQLPKPQFQITDYDDLGRMTMQGTYVQASDWYYSSYQPDGMVIEYNSDGSISRQDNYVAGKLEGKSDYFWTLAGHKIHNEEEYKDDLLLSSQVFIDDNLYSTSSYMPDGSIKSYKKSSPAPKGVEI